MKQTETEKIIEGYDKKIKEVQDKLIKDICYEIEMDEQSGYINDDFVDMREDITKIIEKIFSEFFGENHSQESLSRKDKQNLDSNVVSNASLVSDFPDLGEQNGHSLGNSPDSDNLPDKPEEENPLDSKPVGKCSADFSKLKIVSDRDFIGMKNPFKEERT